MKDIQGRVISIRAYTDSDYKGLKEMYDGFEPMGIEAGLPPANEKIRLAWIDQMVSSFFNIIAAHRKLIVGHAALDKIDCKGCPEYLIFIRKEYRHCGVGTKMSEIMKQVAKSVGYNRVWLNVRTGNAIAVRVFKKVGFRFVGEIDIQREMELVIKKR